MAFYFGGHTYEVYDVALNWADARNEANAYGGYLAQIGSKAENTAVFKNLMKESKTWDTHYIARDGGNGEYVWIGGNDLKTEGQWKWSDGSKVTYTNWGFGGEPDNFHNQDGMAIGITHWPQPDGGLGDSGQWNDLNVIDGLYSLIEYDGLYGSNKADTISGSNKADIFYGAGGNDTLKGLGGADQIRGGAGADNLFGGKGADTFIYKAKAESGTGASDTIHDFYHSQHDKIDLSSVTKGQLEFIGTKGFSDHTPQVRFEISSHNTTVFVDTDGNGKSDMAIHLVGALHLQASDFML